MPCAGCLFLDNGVCTLTLKKAALCAGPSPCFRLSFDLCNTSDAPFVLTIEHLAIEGVPVIPGHSTSSGVLAPGESCTYLLEYDRARLNQAGVRSASTFDFLFVGKNEDYTQELFAAGITMSEFPVDFSAILTPADE